MLDKKYNHLEVEKDKYQNYLKADLFKAGDKTKEAFTIVIPPPNVTGNLHLGHAWDTTLQDIIIRYKKMRNYDVLWLPGMDHAGIATQTKVVKRLRDMGKDPKTMKREEFLDYAWEWKDEYSKNIRRQWEKLGLFLDYSRERFTLDEGLNKAVNHVFISLYKEGLIYRGERIINWDPEAETALSNEEVIHKEIEGSFYYLKYYLEDSDEFLTVATTRPETIFGDTAVAVNPDDKRYKDLVGKRVKLPLLEHLVPIIADSAADPEFGTGVVKVTPAHDPNDFEIGQRHDLEKPIVINQNGTMNEKAGKYNGMDRFLAREKFVEELKTADLVIKEEKLLHNVGHSERTDVIVEPYLSKQWFVKMRPLADRVLENQKNKATKLNFIPERYEKVMNHWMEITYDWCISRQLWWGHRIPAWYKGEEIYVGENPPAGFIQDEDVLDTWFSSALWPFSTLGWPEETEDFKRYYPCSVLVTGYDIIPFWVNRMTFQALHFTGEIPFKDCLIHGLIRDSQGRKMSKSLDNGIDPMDLIEEYGADALRLFLTGNAAPGQDLRYEEEKLKASWNFINKLWNASRFVLMNDKKENEELSLADKWILSKRNKVLAKIIKAMDNYDFHNVQTMIYDFVWNDYCDWYIELSKAKPNQDILISVLLDILKILYPFTPFVCEEIYSKLPINKKDFIALEEYPSLDDKIFEKETEILDKVIEDIISIRNLKATNNIAKDTKYSLEVKEELELIYNSQLRLDSKNKVEFTSGEYPSYESNRIKIVFYNDTVNKEQLVEEIKKLKQLISRRENLLANENYLNKAPAAVVEADKKKLVEEKEKLIQLEKKL